MLCHLPLLHLAARGRDIEPRSATRPKSKGLFDDTYLKRDSAAVSALSGHGRTFPREGVTYSIAMTLTALPALERPEPSPTAAFRGAFLTPMPPGGSFHLSGAFSLAALGSSLSPRGRWARSALAAVLDRAEMFSVHFLLTSP